MAEPNREFFSACRTGNLDVVRQCLGNGIDPNILDKYSMTGLINAARKGRVEIAEYLQLHGADLDLGDLRNRTALFHAVSFGHVDFVESMIGWGAILNTVDRHGWTPLDMAIQQENTAIASLLEQAGAVANTFQSNSNEPEKKTKSDDVRDAIAFKIAERMGRHHHVEFGCYVKNDDGKIVDNLNEIAINDFVVFVAEPNSSWDDDAQGSYQSRCLDSPTWLDLCETLQEQIDFSGDTGHCVLEDIAHVETIEIDGSTVQVYQFILGS